MERGSQNPWRSTTHVISFMASFLTSWRPWELLKKHCFLWKESLQFSSPSKLWADPHSPSRTGLHRPCSTCLLTLILSVPVLSGTLTDLEGPTRHLTWLAKSLPDGSNFMLDLRCQVWQLDSFYLEWYSTDPSIPNTKIVFKQKDLQNWQTGEMAT